MLEASFHTEDYIR